MENQYQYGSSEQPDIFKSARHFAGIALIVIGCVMALYIFIHIYQLIKKPEQIELVTLMLPDDPNIRELTIDDQQIRIPMGVFYFFAYLIMALLLSIASGIGIGFIKAGAGLIYPRVDRLEARLAKESLKWNSLASRLKSNPSILPKTSSDVKPPSDDTFQFGINRDKDE
ncbi:hypothetical protein JW926_09575 [Candidatus Sumerlaeota bacterium]|nr:hypothetical protein [Candidatus Sumerlaeota bacterium]